MRKKQIKKNPRITFGIGFIFLIPVIWQIIFLDPALVKDLLIPSTYLSFFIPFSIALFFLLGTFLQNTRRSLLISLIIIIFLYLRIMELGTLLNLFLLLGLVITLELYFGSKKS